MVNLGKEKIEGCRDFAIPCPDPGATTVMTTGIRNHRDAVATTDATRHARNKSQAVSHYQTGAEGTSWPSLQGHRLLRSGQQLEQRFRTFFRRGRILTGDQDAIGENI
jgi:hypothetical protein